MPIEDVGALDRARANTVRTPRPPLRCLHARGAPPGPRAAVPSRSAAPSPTPRPHRSGCSRSADLQGKRVPLTALPALRVFYAPSVSPCSGHRYARAADLAAAAREASPRGGHVFREDRAVLGGDPENALQPRHARSLQEFLRNDAQSALQRPPLPPPRGRFDGRNSLQRSDFPAATAMLATKATRSSRSATPCRSTSLKHSCSPGWEPPESAQNR